MRRTKVTAAMTISLFRYTKNTPKAIPGISSKRKTKNKEQSTKQKLLYKHCG
jgi:hypothetical protein